MSAGRRPPERSGRTGALEAEREPTVDPERLRRIDRSGPRYTSYPTAAEFHEGVGEAEYLDRLAQADEREPGKAVGLYVHLPFCERACTFCACHFVATPQRRVVGPYLERIRRELGLLAERLPRRRSLAQMQWGGGTPTFLAPDELAALHDAIAGVFAFAPGAERSIEIDPRVTTVEHLETLAGLGFGRLSMGVQDFDPEVQRAIGRGQGFEETRALVAAARGLGFAGGINFDLVYGLPGQDRDRFAASLERVVELAPDRLALYSFAYVPWARPHQRRLDEAALPAGEAKLALFLAARQRLVAGGWEPVGIDHFARPGDELARAARTGSLDRNFMGYTARPASTTVALGASGIGEIEGAYVQNARRLADYYAAIDSGRLPIARGRLLDADDLLRRHVIRELMCNFAVDKAEVERRFGVEFDAHFADERARLAGGDATIPAGLVRDLPGRLETTEEGALFVRNVCMAFDRYLAGRQAAGRPVFSRTV